MNDNYWGYHTKMQKATEGTRLGSFGASESDTHPQPWDLEAGPSGPAGRVPGTRRTGTVGSLTAPSAL
jgi:hypothetical protein